MGKVSFKYQPITGTTGAGGTLTRPSNTTAYAAGDVISAVTSNDHYTFTGVVEYDGAGTACIESALLIDSANQSTKPDLELWLFSSDIAEVADNSAFAPTDAEMATLIGIIPFPVGNFYAGDATSGAVGNCACPLHGLNIPIKVGPGANVIYGQLVVRNAYTPVSAEIFTCILGIVAD